MKLKTLKDLCREQKTEEGFRCNFPLVLKQESLKWIKAFEECIKEYPQSNIDIHTWKGIIDYIKKFNNITEEELL